MVFQGRAVPGTTATLGGAGPQAAGTYVSRSHLLIKIVQVWKCNTYRGIKVHAPLMTSNLSISLRIRL
jgi:hypothetical protein